MTWSPVGSWLGASSASLTVSNQAVGNLLVAEVISYDNVVWCTGLTGGGVTWTLAGVKFAGSTNAWYATVFFGHVTATGAGTAVPSWSGTAPAFEIAGHEFHSTVGSWALDKQGNLDSAGTANWPSLTPAGSGELYFGFSIEKATASAGSTTGFTYGLNADTDGDCGAFNPACGSGATYPVWGDSGQEFGIAVLVSDAAGSPLVTTTSLPEAVVGQAYSATLAATGGTSPYTWSISAGALPGWASLNSSTGEITGTPSSAGVSSFTAEVTDHVSATATAALTLAAFTAGVQVIRHPRPG